MAGRYHASGSPVMRTASVVSIRTSPFPRKWRVGTKTDAKRTPSKRAERIRTNVLSREAELRAAERRAAGIGLSRFTQD